MSKKKNSSFMLRKYLTPDEASIYLSEHLDGQFDEVGVLRYVLEEKLTLSVKLINRTTGLEVLDCSPDLAKETVAGRKEYYPFNSAKKRLRKILKIVPRFSAEIGRYEGMWHIVLTDLAKIIIHNRIYDLLGIEKIPYTPAPDCICLKNNEGKM